MKYFSTISVIMLCSISACEERINEIINAEQTNLIVVEGVLTNERINHRIMLTLPYSSQNQTVQPVTGAVVTIRDSDNNQTLLNENPIGSGEYYTDSLRAVFGKTYVLNINYNGIEFTATDSPPAGQQMNQISYSKKADNDLYYRLNLSSSGSEPNYIDHNINWQQTEFCTNADIECKGRIVHYDLKTIDVQERYAPDKEDFFFPLGSRIIRKKYTVSEQYHEFLRSLLSETEWRGGVFDVERANVPTNLSKGAIGFFAVTTVVSDTVVVE
jgi:hypothetical protein